MLCTIDDCSKEATHTFVWPWGTEGACCQDHVVVVQQKARNARGRMGQVSFTRLDPDRPVEIRRDERIELHSARLTAEAERDDAKLRAQKLFAANTELAKEAAVMRARLAQYEHTIRELEARVVDALKERDAALLKTSEAQAELERFGVNTPVDKPSFPNAPPPLRNDHIDVGLQPNVQYVGGRPPFQR